MSQSSPHITSCTQAAKLTEDPPRGYNGRHPRPFRNCMISTSNLFTSSTRLRTSDVNLAICAPSKRRVARTLSTVTRLQIEVESEATKSGVLY